MGVHIGDNKLVLATGYKTFHFDLPKHFGSDLKYKTDYIIKHYKLLN